MRPKATPQCDSWCDGGSGSFIRYCFRARRQRDDIAPTTKMIGVENMDHFGGEGDHFKSILLMQSMRHASDIKC